jgi:hypothetical protein
MVARPGGCGGKQPLRLVRTSNRCSPRRRGSDSSSAQVGANLRFSKIGGFCGEGAIVLLRAASLLLVAWLLGVGGLYDVGSLVHVSLLVGLMLLLLAILKVRDTEAARNRTDSGPAK